MSTTADALRAVASLLVSAGVGTYQQGAANPSSGLPAIVMKRLPATPDRVIVLNLVTNGDSRAGDTVAVMVQVRCRGAANDPLDVDDIADAIFPVLNSINQLPLAGGGVLTQLLRRTSVQNGTDENGRSERIDQFYGDLGTAVSIS